MEWTMEHNIIYCRDILLVNPFQSKKGSVERGSLWTQIADNMNSLVSPKFIVTQRSVREHLAVLQKKYQKKMRQEEEASGISPEKTELDILLEEIYVAEQIGEEEQEEASRMNQEKTDQEQARADDVRRTAMETFAETQKRNGDEKEKKTKRKRRSGGEMVDYLKEKFESEQKVRKEEMEVKYKMLELEEKKHTANVAMQKDASKQQMEMLHAMQDQNIQQQKQQQQQFQQHMQQTANLQMMLMQNQQEQQRAMLEFFSKLTNKN
ncbi:Hypothetical predicted protein [Paramuricea clavata]|uniref:Uncharacterized protein n=1 Tax=Paramuricea clavata TaxID=317549 RepID=A0A7D9IZH2_PARCT|nr:Hypothetical predicted protein [Paramuricea clavata]